MSCKCQQSEQQELIQPYEKDAAEILLRIVSSKIKSNEPIDSVLSNWAILYLEAKNEIERAKQVKMYCSDLFQKELKEAMKLIGINTDF